MPKPGAPEVTKVAGQETTSYVSPGQEIEKYYKRDAAKPPRVDQKLENAHFINAAIMLANHLGFNSFDEAVTALLVAKTTNPDFDYGVLKHMKGTSGSKKAAESIEKNMPVLQEAIDNSFEKRVRRMAEALDGVKKQFEAEDGWVFPIATMKEHAIVLNSHGDLFRATYEDDEGTIRITKAEKFAAAPVKTEESQKVLGEAVEALMEGRGKKAKLALRDLVARTHDQNETFDKARFQSLVQQIAGESYWRNYVKENGPRVRVFVRGDLKEVYGSGVRPRFQKVRLGEVDEKFEDRYRADVRKYTAALVEKIEKMKEDVQGLFNRDQWRVNGLAAYDKQQGLQVSNFLNHFIGDYVNSLTTVAEGLRLSVVESTLPFQAHLYDTLAEEYPNYVLGYLFIKKALGDIRSGV